MLKPVIGIDISLHVNDTLYAAMGNRMNIQFYKYFDLVAFLKHIKNISIPPIWVDGSEKLASDTTQPLQKNNILENKVDTSNYQLQHTKPKGRIKTFFKKLFHKNSTTTDVTITIQNQNLTTAAGKNYLEYDIFISATNSNFKLAAIMMSLLYDPVNFGYNVIANNKATVTLNTNLFNPNAYTYSLYDVYFGITGLAINFPLADINFPLIQLTPTPQKLLY